MQHSQSGIILFPTIENFDHAADSSERSVTNDNDRLVAISTWQEVQEALFASHKHSTALPDSNARAPGMHPWSRYTRGRTDPSCDTLQRTCCNLGTLVSISCQLPYIESRRSHGQLTPHRKQLEEPVN